MKRPALYIGLPYLLGLLIASEFDILSWSVILLAAVGVIVYRRSVWKYVVLSTLSCLIACCSYWQHTKLTETRQKELAGLELTFCGEVIEKTVYSGGSADYILQGYIDRGEIPAKIDLFTDDNTLNYGDSITIFGRPQKIESGFLFDKKNYAKARNIFLCFDFATEFEIQEIKPAEKLSLSGKIYAWRESMSERIQGLMPEDTGAMLTGMLFGDKSGMRHSQKTALYRTGIGHILAVSGLHLDFLAVCIGWLMEKLKAGRKIKFLLITVTGGLFVVCAGGTVSVKRAFIMILLSQSAKLFFRQADAFNSLAIAVLILGVENPFVIHNPAFWLSCTGAFGIGVAGAYMIQELPEKEFYHLLLKDLTAFTWVSVIILPVSVLYFREFSLISPLSNILLVPFCMLSMICGLAAVLLGCQGSIAELLLHTADTLNQFILEISDFFAGLNWTHASTDSEILVFVIYAGAALVLLFQICFRSRKLTAVSAAMVLLITCITVNIENLVQEKNLKIAVLGETSQCLIAVRYGQDAVLLDMTGNYYAPDYAETYLDSVGVRHVESLFLHNPKEKTIRKYQEYLKFLPPEEVWCMKEPKNKIKSEYLLHFAQQKEILFHGAKIQVSQKQIKIQYADKIYICKNDKTQIAETPDILTVYGKSKTVQPDCGYLLFSGENQSYLPDAHTYVNQNNLEFTISEQGQCRIRSLYGTGR